MEERLKQANGKKWNNVNERAYLQHIIVSDAEKWLQKTCFSKSLKSGVCTKPETKEVVER
jgi:hypothetical protein